MASSTSRAQHYCWVASQKTTLRLEHGVRHLAFGQVWAEFVKAYSTQLLSTINWILLHCYIYRCKQRSTKVQCTVVFRIGKPDHRPNERLWFYNAGLGGTNEVNDKKWLMKTFSTLLHENKHTEVCTSVCWIRKTQHLAICRDLLPTHTIEQKRFYITESNNTQQSSFNILADGMPRRFPDFFSRLIDQRKTHC